MNRARHEPVEPTAASATEIGGIFVVGMYSSGVELVGEALSAIGLPALNERDDPQAANGLQVFNDRLLAAGGGSDGGPPAASPAELAHTLAPWLDEAGRKGAAAGLAATSGIQGGTWAWADPRLSFLAPFWAHALSVRPAVILMHRDPGQVIANGAPGVADPAEIIGLWDRYNRSALVLCSMFPSLVLNYDETVRQPKAALGAIVDFLGDHGVGVDGDVGQAAELITGLVTEHQIAAVDSTAIGARHATLHRVLAELDGERAGEDPGRIGALVDATAQFYDRDYYGASYDQGGVPYGRDEKVWIEFMATVAASVVKTLRPSTSLDVGCALGLLVEALRERGVDARGFDLSPWAIQQIPGYLQPYCWVGSLTDEIEDHFDLITCVEVLEHLPPILAEAGVANLCRHAQMVLFSSTPDDFDEPTHLNVEPSGYWVNLFLRHGFVRDLDYDASFVSSHAMLFRRGESDVSTLVDNYERKLWAGARSLEESEDEREQLESALVEAEAVKAANADLTREASALRDSLRSESLRRTSETLAAFEAVREFESSQRRLAARLNHAETELNAVRHTKTFKYTVKLRRAYGRLRRQPAASETALAPAPVHAPDGSYQTWVQLFDSIDDGVRRQIQARVQELARPPKISVMMPVFNPPIEMLQSAIDSVRNQIYTDWELCIADDCSTDPLVPQLLEECAASDARIKVIRREENGHISAASNSALSLVTSQWVALLDHDDILAEHALALVALALAENPDAGIVYSDEDKLDQAGHRRDPYFKPDFDPLLLLGQNFVSHLSVFRKDLVDRAGGYRLSYEGSQDWDLTLRVSELIEPRQVVHIPHVLYHWRVHASSTASMVSAKPYAVEAGLRAVTDHLERTGRPARVNRIGQWGFNRVSWDLPDPAPRVTIVIPTRDGPLLPRCIDSVLSFTMYPNFEVVVVDNSSRTLGTLEYLRACDHRVTVIRDDRPFNHSAINNSAVASTSGEIVCLLSDDTEVISGDWLTEMVAQVSQPGVGAVGAKLYYGDGRIEHAGVILGIHGVAAHAHLNFDRLSVGYFGQLQLAHHMSAVTAACAVVRREAWDAVNGFDEEHLPAVFNDVDFCLRLREAGWGLVWTPYAELFHRESTSGGIDDEGPPAEAFGRAVAYMEMRWSFMGLRQDPYYSPNLTLDAEDFSLAWPPRTSYRANT